MHSALVRSSPAGGKVVVAALPPTGRTPLHLEVVVDERTGDLVFREIAETVLKWE